MTSSGMSFRNRHIGTDSVAQRRMLDQLGYGALEDLINAAIPAAIQVDKFRPLGSSLLPVAASETETIEELRAMASRNTVRRTLIGQGYYGTITPAVIKRNVLENPSWYTAYTPYQPEISQGRLEAILNFQTMVCDLTGLDIANGSMLDEGTAAVEAMLLARRSTKVESNVFVVDADAFPQTKSLILGRAEPLDIEIVEVDFAAGEDVPACFGVLIQYPGASGRLADPSGVIPHSLRVSGHSRCRRRRWHEPALRSSARLRWSARRLHGGQEWSRAQHARPTRGRLGRRCG
jgi:glycine dehydrogenase